MEQTSLHFYGSKIIIFWKNDWSSNEVFDIASYFDMKISPKTSENFPEQDFFGAFLLKKKTYGVIQQQIHAVCSFSVTQGFL